MEETTMKENVKNEWKEYLLEEKEYTFEQFIEKYKHAIGYLKKKHMRISDDFFVNQESNNQKYHLSDRDKMFYEKEYEGEGYSPLDCKKIINVMDVLYQLLDISKEEARKFTSYIAENHLTLTDAIERKYGLSLKECNEYKESILLPYADYYAKKVIQEGWMLITTLAEIFSDTE